MSTYRLKNLLSPRSMALIGASPKPGSVGRAILGNIRKAQFKGEFALVNPHHAVIDGVSAVDSFEKLPFVPEHCEQPWHMFYMVMPSLEVRQALIAHLRSREILSVFLYLPLHLSEMGRRWGGKEGDCPVTESVSGRLIRLPFYNELSETDQARVVDAVNGFVCG